MTRPAQHPIVIARMFLRTASASAVLTAALLPALVAGQAPQRQRYQVLHRFTGSPIDGQQPLARLLRDAKRNLYGTTASGGLYGTGTIFKLERNGKETVLFNFTGDSGIRPDGGLIQDEEGNLYGTASYGGDLTCVSGVGCGTVFKLNTAGKLIVLHRFNGPAAFPYGPLVRDNEGNLYGTTQQSSVNGNFHDGTVFKLDTTGTLTVLTSGGINAGVILDEEGNLYGTIFEGAVFKLDRNGLMTVLNATSNPTTGPVRDAAGNLYFGGGLTDCTAGGSDDSDCGRLFKLDTAGVSTVLHTFTGGADGLAAIDTLALDESGNLYGASGFGGLPNCSSSTNFFSGCGTAFKLDTAGNLTILHSFTGGTDGGIPLAGVTRDKKGNLYGTVVNQIGLGDGLVFKINGDFPRSSGSPATTPSR